MTKTLIETCWFSVHYLLYTLRHVLYNIRLAVCCTRYNMFCTPYNVYVKYISHTSYITRTCCGAVLGDDRKHHVYRALCRRWSIDQRDATLKRTILKSCEFHVQPSSGGVIIIILANVVISHVLILLCGYQTGRRRMRSFLVSAPQ